jgi:cellulose synthase/poly-beta-1,6-N-acetylglucosamine synthase-like glycosyltransferase
MPITRGIFFIGLKYNPIGSEKQSLSLFERKRFDTLVLLSFEAGYRKMELFLIIAAILYATMMVLLSVGLRRASKIEGSDSYEPTVSIIVAARDEELHIGECLRSLVRLDYPREKLQAVIVNDGSKDRTEEIAEDIVRCHPWMKLIATRPGEGNLRGKSNAVSAGIDSSSGEILMFTDADCRVPPHWIRQTARYIDKEIGIVGGYTLLDANRIFEGMQALDWLFLFSISGSTAGWRIPLTAIGNNLTVRRSAYNLTGGYRDIPFSVTEDYSLVRSILERSDYHVRFLLNPSTLVRSKACPTWKQLYRQKQRWGVGGLDMVFPGMIIMWIGWVFRLSLLVSCFTCSPLSVLAATACLGLMDLQFLWKPLKVFDRLDHLKYFPVFELYFSFYVLFIPFVAILSKKVVWKERKL